MNLGKGYLGITYSFKSFTDLEFRGKRQGKQFFKWNIFSTGMGEGNRERPRKTERSTDQESWQSIVFHLKSQEDSELKTLHSREKKRNQLHIINTQPRGNTAMTQNRDILTLCILNMICDNALFVISLSWLNGGRMKVNKITTQCHNISSDVYPWQIPQ